MQYTEEHKEKTDMDNFSSSCHTLNDFRKVICKLNSKIVEDKFNKYSILEVNLEAEKGFTPLKKEEEICLKSEYENLINKNIAVKDSVQSKNFFKNKILKNIKTEKKNYLRNISLSV